MQSATAPSIPDSQNRTAGYWNTISCYTEPYTVWKLACLAIMKALDRTDIHSEDVGCFLDSDYGRDFAEEVVSRIYDLTMKEAIEAAVKKWLHWTITSTLQRQTGMQRAQPYLYGVIGLCRTFQAFRKWVSIKDRKPPDNTLLLVIEKSPSSKRLGWKFGYKDERIFWLSHSEAQLSSSKCDSLNFSVFFKEATHWLALPPIPSTTAGDENWISPKDRPPPRDGSPILMIQVPPDKEIKRKPYPQGETRHSFYPSYRGDFSMAERMLEHTTHYLLIPPMPENGERSGYRSLGNRTA